MPSRWDRILSEGQTPVLRDPGPLGYVVPLWQGAGRYQMVYTFGGGHPAPIPHQEVEAYGARHGLTPSERDLIRSMSEAYARGYRAGFDVFSKPPGST